MFVTSSLEIPFSLNLVRLELDSSVPSWLSPLALAMQARREELLTHVGLETASYRGTMRLEVEEPKVERHVVSTAFRIWIEGAQEWPSFDRTLRAAWLGPRCTQLELEGQYRAPAGLNWGEQVLLRHVLQAVNREFLQGVAQELTRRLEASAKPPPISA
jgi:hypothetical protein